MIAFQRDVPAATASLSYRFRILLKTIRAITVPVQTAFAKVQRFRTSLNYRMRILRQPALAIGRRESSVTSVLAWCRSPQAQPRTGIAATPVAMRALRITPGSFSRSFLAAFACRLFKRCPWVNRLMRLLRRILMPGHVALVLSFPC